MVQKRKYRLFTFLVKMCLYTVICWALGLALFIFRLPEPTAPDALMADAIIVLTGGAGRLEAGVGLIEKKVAERMLVTGVHPDVTGHELPVVTGTNPALFSCCVDLDYKAGNTLGNARETARWARKNNYSTLIIVTSDYHMPRSLALFRRSMPEATLIEFPVKVGWHPLQIMKEYTKYIAVLMQEAAGL